MISYRTKARRLALSIIAGRWDKGALAERLSRVLCGGPPDPARLVARLLFHFEVGSPPSMRQLTKFLQDEELFHQFLENSGEKIGQSILLDSPVMGLPPETLLTLPLPRLATWKDLRVWLGLFDNELAWFADRDGRQSKVVESRLHHYRYRWATKQSGQARLIEMPKSRLKAIQRQVLQELINRIPPHPCAHGFTRGRSCLTYVAPHVGKAVVLRMDLKDFFCSIPTARVAALFRRLGYPSTVAQILQGLCTHAVSPSLVGALYLGLSWETRKRLRHKHLPQGAPTSPAIANLCAWRLDCRLQGMSDHFGLDYTRYADDLAFSGSAELIRLAPYLQGLVGAIALEEGFRINHRKTRVKSQGQCQRLAGVVVNKKPNLRRREYDQLKATLYNCVRFGPESQNRRGHADYRLHLAGRVAHVTWLNPAKGERLQALWNRVQW